MNRPKLLLPWPTKSNPHGLLIDAVLGAWTSSLVDTTVVVVKEEDDALLQACQRWPVQIVTAKHRPADMKSSIQIGIRWLQSANNPVSLDRLFIAPADIPNLNADLIDRLIQECLEPSFSTQLSSVLVPKFGNATGHPVSLPWQLAMEILALGKDEGVNSITRRHPKIEIIFPPHKRVDDIDTPQEYELALRNHCAKDDS